MNMQQVEKYRVYLMRFFHYEYYTIGVVQYRHVNSTSK